MNKNNVFSDVSTALQFLANAVDIYGVSDGSFVENFADNRFLVFFSRSYLRAHQWLVVPLWEGDLRVLIKEDGTQIDFLKRICISCMQSNERFLHLAAVEEGEWKYSAEFMALTIATKKFDVFVDDPSELFRVSSINLPYWGHNFFWPSSERFVIYTDGDNVSFIAGEQGEIESILGVSYSYCRERFVSASLAHQAQPDLVEAYVRFCDEFVR